MKKALLITLLSIAVVGAGYGLVAAHGGNGNSQRGSDYGHMRPGYDHMDPGYGNMAPGYGHMVSWFGNIGSGFQHMMGRFFGTSDGRHYPESYGGRDFHRTDRVNERPHWSFR